MQAVGDCLTSRPGLFSGRCGSSMSLYSVSLDLTKKFSALVSSINRQVKGAPRLHASRKPHREQLSEFNYCTLCLLDLTRLCNVCSAPDLQVKDYK